MKPEEFLSKEQQELVVEAIRKAESVTSGEIRVHIDSLCPGNPEKQAVRVFRRLGMEKTRQRNGVLIYVACNSRVFAIVGDKGINDAVPEGFWEDVSAHMGKSFAEGKFAEGICAAVLSCGEKLKTFFPYRSDDINEQTDEISY